MEDLYLKENVLEIETQPVFDNWYAWRVTKQNLDVLPYGSYINKKNEIIVNEPLSRMHTNDFNIHNDYYLYLKSFKEDNYFGILHKDVLDELLEKVKKINELYGVKRRRKPEKDEKYYYINNSLIDGFEYEEAFWKETELEEKMFENNNCFLNKKECIEKLKKIKNILKE